VSARIAVPIKAKKSFRLKKFPKSAKPTGKETVGFFQPPVSMTGGSE
jgi:hypothetical protein